VPFRLLLVQLRSLQNCYILHHSCPLPDPGFDACTGTGVKGDPHFTGADRSHFDFTGKPEETYCLVSDSHLHINAYYGGRYATNKTGGASKPLTWIRKVALLWGHHSVKLSAREGAAWGYNSGYMAQMEVDGKQVTLSQPGDSIALANEKIHLTWLAAKERSGDDEVDVYQVEIKGVMTMRLTLRPEVASLRTANDGVVHFNLDFVALELSNKAHGVLGQTYRADHKDRL
jgi:Root cap